MQDIYQETLNKAVELHKQMRLKEAEVVYNQLLNVFPFSEGVNFCLADLYLRKEYNGLAINLLSNLLQNNPKHVAAWVNLGCAYRKENDYARAEGAWHKALHEGGLTVELATNFASLYGDRGKPEKAIEWLDKGLKLEPGNPKALWAKSLALLSLREWEEGWKLYENRTQLETWYARDKINAPRWDGSYVDRLYIHGEQGVGDEVMFASCLPFVKAKHVTVEVNPKVAPLIYKSFPDFDVVTQEFEAEFDAKIPIGSLMGMFGPNPQPYLNPDPWRVKFYREELEKLGPGPYVALTWNGGLKQTRAADRCINLSMLKGIQDKYTCVSAQYSCVPDQRSYNPISEEERANAGLHQINYESAGADLHEQAALFKAVDAVVTVQQTAVHVAGGVGAKTFAIIGSSPHWRYGIEGDALPWYGSVKLFRRQTTWEEAIARVSEELDAYLKEKRA